MGWSPPPQCQATRSRPGASCRTSSSDRSRTKSMVCWASPPPEGPPSLMLLEDSLEERQQQKLLQLKTPTLSKPCLVCCSRPPHQQQQQQQPPQQQRLRQLQSAEDWLVEDSSAECYSGSNVIVI